jgi:hypothetical protein
MSTRSPLTTAGRVFSFYFTSTHEAQKCHEWPYSGPRDQPFLLSVRLLGQEEFGDGRRRSAEQMALSRGQ